jgi:hypothetical protein
MPLKTFKTKTEIPADQQADALALADGTFAVFADVDTTELESAVAAEKEKREAAEKLSRKTAAELQKLQTARKAADAGLTEERLKEIRAEADKEARAELAPQLEEAAKLKAQNRALVLDADMKARALKAGILPTKIDDFWKLRGSEFDLTADGKPMVKDKPTVEPDKHLAALLKLNPEWVAGTKASGSGAAGLTAANGPTGVFAETMAPEHRLAAAHEAGLTE